MKDEFVGVKKSYSIECFDGEDWYTVNRTHPDFATAVAALQSLVPQSKPIVSLIGIHPAVGLKYCEVLQKVIEEKDEQCIKRLRDFAQMLGLASQPREGEEDKWVYLTDGVWIYLDKDKKE
jgi:hypothetical protein